MDLNVPTERTFGDGRVTSMEIDLAEIRSGPPAPRPKAIDQCTCAELRTASYASAQCRTTHVGGFTHRSRWLK